jgi:hypothetical protein
MLRFSKYFRHENWREKWRFFVQNDAFFLQKVGLCKTLAFEKESRFFSRRKYSKNLP